MGCVSSKRISCQSPPYDDDVCFTSCAGGASRKSRQRSQRLSAAASLLVEAATSRPSQCVKEAEVVVVKVEEEGVESGGKRQDYDDNSSEKLRELKRVASQKKAAPFNAPPARSSQAELAAAGWPAWLVAVAAPAIEGWVPLRSDAYERLDKIGQGTYSNVYRARDLKTGKIVAVKKVRFDNFEPESVKFMAREIQILRMLDHPNVMKLEGIITSRLSCTIYLVFEYMEHDLAGLLSSPDIKFTESQIKCFMKQLLSGLKHCHSRGIMHRDIKSSNVLVSNDGVLKIADFGLAYFTRPRNRQPLTSRVVTLWYRPTELLLGSTNYGGEVDLWSVGCVFAELFMGRPILKGRTEVEQLHKIFRLCGTPPDEYWRTTRLPLAEMFKPQQPYESTLRERLRELPDSAVDLIETLLSIEPAKRGTAAAALQSEYFCTKPYACDPSSMPRYAANKEMDAKAREDERRIKGIPSKPEAASRNSRKIRDKAAQAEESKAKPSKRRNGVAPRAPTKQSYDTRSDVSAASNSTQDSVTSTKSVPVTSRRQKQVAVFTRLHSSAMRGQKLDALESTDCQDNDDDAVMINGTAVASKRRERGRFMLPGSFDSSEMYDAPEFTQNDQPRLAIRRSRFQKD